MTIEGTIWMRKIGPTVVQAFYRNTTEIWFQTESV